LDGVRIVVLEIVPSACRVRGRPCEFQEDVPLLHLKRGVLWNAVT